MIFDLGDIMVSKPTTTFPGVIQYNFGKTVQDGHFTRTDSLNRPPDVLLGAVSKLQAKAMMEGHKLSEYLPAMAERYPAIQKRICISGYAE